MSTLGGGDCIQCQFADRFRAGFKVRFLPLPGDQVLSNNVLDWGATALAALAGIASCRNGPGRRIRVAAYSET
jgi:hypothetical protein